MEVGILEWLNLSLHETGVLDASQWSEVELKEDWAGWQGEAPGGRALIRALKK